MASSHTQRAALGYHKIGDHFYFAVLEAGNRFFGQQADEEFHTPHAFAGLVTAVHEHHHLMQELSQGYFWWRQATRDLLLVMVSQAARHSLGAEISFPLWHKPHQPPRQFDVERHDPLAVPKALVFELDRLHGYWNAPDMTQTLLANEMRSSPELARFVNEDVSSLTTIDLVECQAAILTELYLTDLLNRYPARFDAQLAHELASLFRVDQMDTAYLRPLRALVHVLGMMGIEVRVESAEAHPLYQQITYGPLYVLLAFLLDYALHLPPNPFALLSKMPDVACQQDIYPPFRFINLAFLYALELKTNRRDLKNALSSEPRYYSQGSPALASLVNDMHAAMRRMYVDGEILDTFFSIEQTSRQWAAYFKGHPIEHCFPMLYTLQSDCVQFRLDHPDFWLALSPLDFDMAVHLPRVFITGRGLGAMPYGTPGPGLGPDQLKAYLTEAAKTHFEGFLSGQPDRQAMARFPATLVPFRFMEAWLAREMSCRFATRILYGEKLRCPMTESIGRYMPCRPRTPACESIVDFRHVPARDCLLRESVEQLFGGLDRYHTQER